jgi:osmoprotectant transport system ATP-binding protein
MFPVIFENVSKSFSFPEKMHSQISVLDNISLEINENKITVVIGRSGSGKSTLLKLINGLLKPDNGHVKIFNKEINYSRLNALRKDIGYSVQGVSLFPHMNVFDNISLLARINFHAGERINDRVLHLLKMVGLPENYLQKYPYELSGGEQQRVGICRAMMLNPEIFLLDEAFGALDPVTKNEIHQKLLHIQASEPRTIIIVTHDLAEAFHLADQIIIIEKGIIQQTGTPEDIRSRQANEFVSNYLESQKI